MKNPKPITAKYVGLVNEIMDRYPGKYAIIVMATPMDSGTYIEVLSAEPLTPELVHSVLLEAIKSVEGK